MNDNYIDPVYNSSITKLWTSTVSVVSTMGDTVLLGWEIIVMATLFVIDVYLVGKWLELSVAVTITMHIII